MPNLSLVLTGLLVISNIISVKDPPSILKGLTDKKKEIIKVIAENIPVTNNTIAYNTDTTEVLSASVSAKTNATITISPSLIPTHSPPTPTPEILISDNKANYIFNGINNYRIEKGLKIYETDKTVCDFASLRSSEIQTNFDHSGFDRRISSNSLPYKSYTKIAENIARTEDYSEVLTLWKNSEGHNKNLLSDLRYACIGNTSDNYVFESWTP